MNYQEREKAQKFLAEHPEIELALGDCAVEAMREFDVETTPEAVSSATLDLALALMRRAEYRAAPLVSEVVTEDDVRRVFDEERKRLYDPEICGVEAEKLEAAVTDRLMQEFRRTFPHFPVE